jgi:CBS domain-containing protein
VPKLSGDEPVAEALAELGDGVGRGLVLSGDRLVGLLSMTDVVRALELGALRRRQRQGVR